MLPKVATHLLHTTSRAAASIQNQTHTIRNVLQLQSSGPSSGTATLPPWNNPGSSHWGNHGTGPGGAKHNAGSRFYSGYTGAGRAATQAHTISSNDGSFSQPDDEELSTKRVPIHTPRRNRLRSNSLSAVIHGRHEREEKLGVLKTVQLHARSRHAFALSSTDNAVVSESQHATFIESNPRPILLRRNSTSAPLPSDDFDTTVPLPTPAFIRPNSSSAPAADAFEPLSPPSASPSASPSTESLLLSTDPAAPQTTEPPQSLQHSPAYEGLEAYTLLRSARNSGDPSVAAEAVRHFRQTTTNPSVREYNMALEALHGTRRAGEPLHIILETYNDMLKHSLLPNLRTYIVLIQALTDRDYEIQKLINTLEMRLKRRELSGYADSAADKTDRRRIEDLRAENNFGSAMSLFEAIIAINGNSRCPFPTYHALLRSCAYHASVDSAIHVFAQLEARTDGRPAAIIYKFMIQAYTNVGEIGGAEEIFKEYLKASKQGSIQWNIHKDPEAPRRSHLQLWNQMIEAYFRCGMPDKAVGLVDQMMNSKAGASFGPADVPPTATSTFTAVLSGFCQMGDVATALVWFERLLQQNQATDNPFEMSGLAMRPDSVAWMIMLDALAVRGMVDDLNRLFGLLIQDAGRDGLEVKAMDRLLLFTANMARIKDLDDRQTQETLQFLMQHVIMADQLPRSQQATMAKQIWEAYISKEMYEPAALVLADYAASRIRSVQEAEQASPPSLATTLNVLQIMQLEFTRVLYQKTRGEVPFSAVLQLARVADSIKVVQQQEYTPFFLHSYGLSKKSGTLPLDEMTPRDWELLLYATVDVEAASMEGRALHDNIPQYAFEGLIPLLHDLNERGVAFDDMHSNLVRRTIKLIVLQHGTDELKAIFERLGPSFQSMLNRSDGGPSVLEQALGDPPPGMLQDGQTWGPAPESQPSTPVIDQYQTRFIDEVLVKNTNSSRSVVLQAFKRFSDGIEAGKAPSPNTIGRLIQSLGRLGEMEKVRLAYTIAQTVLKTLETNKKWQADAWFMIEDSMIIALAHYGDVDSAHVHRLRMLEQGGAPTADAYGALILTVKDTTDDTSNAMALFEESQVRGVKPNQYLYNNIISKLAKARKADYALELFQQMKANRINPSSITYGAVIGACARVGDIHSAEQLFSEMVQARNFKPRVPPYNTMMQLYTTTKPNRDRALFFYDELQKAGVAPTAHTYKLLMDAYGVIEPADIESMEQVFKALQQDEQVEIQGNHFSTLINAYGCVQKDLDKAIAIFDSIPSFPRAQPVDAVVFEAMINVLVAHRRTDLIPEYISKMSAAGVHMTAYIANFLIKGYAMVGDLEHARSIFESLVDPPEGVAAPNNHAPHEPTSSPAVSHMAPVYREPSTWESMVRAELGSGDRERALDLLERLKARKYPEAVYNRISGIMVDHSMVLS